MIDIKVPEKVGRGEVLKGNVVISLGKEVNCRNLFISLDNVLTYKNPCVREFSGWSIQNSRVYSSKSERLCNAIIPVEFMIPENAPPGFSGRALNSRWLVKVKIDIPLSTDIHAEKIVEVERS
ncbi:MAG: hypothetical protein KKA10_00970 [Euryarchaeota archaeon]|nr:hypothetical protein [Euryarchaeota archaeon]MCG2735068.1 hypothetical protein [Candidatus Methanoperedenaceae archaeon]